MKIIHLVILLISLNSTAWADNKLITINQFAHHPALDSVTAGIKQGLSEHGIVVGKNIKIIEENSQGNISTSVQVSNHLASLSPDVMIGIATPAVQTILKARKDNKITVGFAAVTDPKGAGFTDKINLLGVSDKPPVEELLTTMLKILPHSQSIGIILNPAEINSSTVVTIAENFAKTKNINVIQAPVASTNDVVMAVKSLVGKVDFIYIPQDNTVVSGINAIAKISRKHKIPLVSNDPSLSDKGILLTLGCNYFESGRQLAGMIAKRLKNKGDLSTNIVDAQAKELRLNHKLVQEFSLKIPDSIKEIN